MPSVRYYLPGVPNVRAGSGVSAFTPSLSWYAASGAVAYKYGLNDGPATNHPMTAHIQYPRPASNDIAVMGGARSGDAPDDYVTDDYNLTNASAGLPWPVSYPERPGAGMPIAVPDPSDTAGWRSLLPVPAQDYRAQYTATSGRLAQRTILNRMKSIPWFPRVYSSTPTGKGPLFNG